MAYKQYTNCISKNDFDSFWNFGGKTQNPVVPLLVWAILQSIKNAFIGGLIGFFAGGPIGAIIGAGIGLTYGFVDGFCDAWLNRRLICIDKDVCAIGKVAWQEAPKKKMEIERLFDNDASFNLRLIPYDGDEYKRYDHNPQHSWEDIKNDGFPASKLLTRAFNDLDYYGYEPDRYPNHPGGRWSLHCEFEGNGMVTMCTIAKGLAVLGPFTAVAGVVVGAGYGAYYGATETAKKAWKTCKKGCKVPILCDVVCAVVTFLAAVVGLVGGAVVGAVIGIFIGPVAIGAVVGDWVNTDGSFQDAANDPASGNIEDEDCVFVLGDLVYDSGHSDGWNEIHPVKYLQKICPKDQSDATLCCPRGLSANFADSAVKTNIQLYWDLWCSHVIAGFDPIVIQAQQDPENQWCLHPLIDGCRPRSEQPPIK